jgi:hypothetical protein
MLAANYTSPGHPRRGSAEWAATRIQQLLEQDEQRRRRMAWADSARHPARQPKQAIGHARANNHPMGSDGWGAQEMLRLIEEKSNSRSPGALAPVTAAPDPQGRPDDDDEPFLTPRDIVDIGISFIPGIGDAYGLYRDIETYIDDPESRTWANFGLTAAGMLPFIPGGMTKIIRKGEKKLEDILEANPRTKIEDIPADATGRLGRASTRETVIRVADEFQKRFDNIEPDRFKLVASGGRKERAIQPVGYDGYEAKRLSEGARFGDIVFLDRKTGKQYIIQVARVDANGRPIAEELDAALKIFRTPTRIPRPYREVKELEKLDGRPEHTVFVVTPPKD